MLKQISLNILSESEKELQQAEGLCIHGLAARIFFCLLLHLLYELSSSRSLLLLSDRLFRLFWLLLIS